MILRTLEESMEKAKKFENITKAAKYSNLFKGTIPEKSPEKEIEMLKKISQYVKDDQIQHSAQDDEILDYITENPDEMNSVLNIKNSVSTGLPFFKSIDYKLSEIFGV